MSEAQVQEQVEDNDANERDWDAEARDMGWVPQEQFKGDPERWKPAQKFVEDGENILPIVNARNKSLEKKIEKMEADFAKRLEAIDRTSKNVLERQKQAHKEEMDRIKAGMKEAVANGDSETYEALEKRRDDLTQNAPRESDGGDDVDSVRSAWMADNSWINDDYEAAMEAQSYGNFLAMKREPKTPAQVKEDLDKIAKHVREKFPEKFGEAGEQTTQRRGNGQSAVDGGGAFPGGGKKGKSYSDLPPEAKSACDRFVADGIISKEQYVKDYFADA